MNNINKIMGLLNEKKYPTEIEENEDNVIKSKYKEVIFFASIYDNDSIQLFSFLNSDEDFSYNEINTLNEKLRFVKHYKMSNGIICIEMDFLFDLDDNRLFFRNLEIWENTCETILISIKNNF